MSRPELFSRRVGGLLAWGGLGALGVTLFFLVFSQPPPPKGAGTDTYSVSALGHHALVELLRTEVPVHISRGHSASKISDRVPLLLLEPRASVEELTRLRDQVVQAVAKRAPVVVALPKWQGTPDPSHPGWVRRVEPIPPAAVERVLATALGWESEGGDAPRLFRPPPRLGAWEVRLNGAGGDTLEVPAPALPFPQLLAADELHLEPLLATPEGLLAARVKGIPVILIADPDLLNTAGLARGDNAVVIHRLFLDHLRPSSFVLDEAIHGYLQTSSVWRGLLRFPLILVTLHLTVLAALVLWAGTGRFGSPLPPPPRMVPGKGALIDNSADLLGLRTRIDHSLGEYLQLTVRRAAERLGVSGGGGFRGQVETLARLGRRRSVSADLETLRREVVRAPGSLAPRRALDLARALHAWRKEICDGSLGDSSARH